MEINTKEVDNINFYDFDYILSLQSNLRNEPYQLVIVNFYDSIIIRFYDFHELF